MKRANLFLLPLGLLMVACSEPSTPEQQEAAKAGNVKPLSAEETSQLKQQDDSFKRGPLSGSGEIPH